MKNNGKAMAKAGKKTFLRLIRTIFGFFPCADASGTHRYFI